MKMLKIMAMCVMLFAACSVFAECPTQPSTIFFANGIDVDQPDARLAKERLQEELVNSGVSNECVLYKLAYNTNEPFFLDIVEALIQKNAEYTGIDNFPWGQWQRAESTTDWFASFVQDIIAVPSWILIESGRWVLGDQRDEHVLAYKMELQKGKNLILVGHSQGSINVKEERQILTPVEQSVTSIVAAAAFSYPEPDQNAYTTMEADILAIGAFTYFDAPPANIPYLGICDDVDPLHPSASIIWYCHSFEKAYLVKEAAKTKIIYDIIAALPTEPSAQYFSTTVGNPGIPGDGIIVTLSGEENTFELQPYFPLQAVTNGITVSVFPITDVPLQNLVIMAKFVSSTEQCAISSGNYATLIPLPVNGIAGVSINYSQERLNALANRIRLYYPDYCDDVSVNDLVITGFYIVDSTQQSVVWQLDAVAIGIGENAFPR